MDTTTDYIEIAGTVKAVLFQNEENGYTVIKLETMDGETITVVGCLPFACPGERICVYGGFEKHSVHGEQFKAEWAQRSMPVGANEIYEFLASRAIKGVGPATATLLVTEFGAKTLQVIENEPERLVQVKGISAKKAAEISDEFRKQAALRRLIEHLSNYSVRPAVAIRLYRLYGNDAMELLEENPYIIAGERIGASFAEADNLALSMGFEGDSAERVAAATLFELRHNSRNGHCFIPVEKLIAATSQLIEVPAEAVEEAMEVMCDSGEMLRCTIADSIYELSES